MHRTPITRYYLLIISSLLSAFTIAQEENKPGQGPLAATPGIVIGSHTSFNVKDVMFGIHTGMVEFKYNLGITLGGSVRISPNKVLVAESENTYYLFRERRHSIELGVEKRFDIFKPASSRAGLALGIKGMNTVGSYAGTDRSESMYMLVPQSGMYWMGQNLMISLHYAYKDFNTVDIPAHRALFSMSYIFTKTRQYH